MSEFGELFDVCMRKHGGNKESTEAFEKIKNHLSHRQRIIFDRIQASDGLTVDQLSLAMDTTPNAISGRITELRMKGKIEKHGTRATRSGCTAAVWVAKCQ